MSAGMQYVDVEEGTLKGSQREGYSVFYSVPYAAPPVGKGRFAPPGKPQHYDGIRNAESVCSRPWMKDPDAASAVGMEFYFAPNFLPPFSEDCLHLHVWTPARSADEKLPVAVWIHGGAFEKGYGTEIEIDGEGFCRRGVILVSVEYRVGIFGFFCHPELAREQGGRCGNYGTLDQLAALQWIRRNIAAFGGDPAKITLIGQSAGAISVLLLSCMKETEGAFRCAIMQSGACYQGPVESLPARMEGEALGESFLRESRIHTIEELRAMPAADIIEAAAQFKARYGEQFTFWPVIGGHLIEHSTDQSIEMGRLHRISYIVGYNADDFWDGGLAEGTGRFAEAAGRLGCRVYEYQFMRRPPAYRKGMYEGSYHSAEIWYVFETLRRSSRPFGSEDETTAARMADAWCSFVKEQKPDSFMGNKWKPRSGKRDVYRFE